MGLSETYLGTISILFLSNLYNTESLRLLESVQLILQPAEMLASYTATLSSFFPAACQYVGQLHSHFLSFFSAVIMVSLNSFTQV